MRYRHAIMNRRRRFGGSAAPAGTITIGTLTYTRGTAGVAPTLASTVSDTGTTTANYTLRGVLAATAQTEAQIDASGNKFNITDATLAGLDGSVDLSNSETSGVISAYVFDSSDPVIKSAVVTETGVTYDAAAPVFSSAEVGTVDATSLIVTFDKALYGSTSAADWDVQVAGSPATESAASISGSTVDITLSAAVTNGQAVTVAYTGTTLLGVDAEQVATFTAETVTNNVAGAFTPDDLFLASEVGAWYDIQDPTTMNTLSDGTGSVPAVGDPVGYVADQSGNGYHMTQPTAGARPTLRQDGSSNYYLEFDGTDDHLQFSIPTTLWTNGLHYCLAYDTQSDASGILYSASGSVIDWAFIFQDTSTSTQLIDIATSTEPPLTLRIDGAAATITNRDSVHTAITGKKVQVWSASGTASARSTPATAGIGDYNSGDLTLSGHLYGLIFRETLDAGEISDVETYLASVSGVTL